MKSSLVPSVLFANAAERPAAEATCRFTNEIALDANGWAHLAPFGDYPGQALRRGPDGQFEQFPALQRLDRAAAEGMVAKFKSLGQRLKRFLTGCPIYAGHPDVPAFANDYPDKEPKGMIVDLEVRDTGLYCKPVFTPAGSELVATKQLRAFSGYWSAVPVAGAPNIFRPDTLKSAGLTNHPNLPVQWMNEQPVGTASTNSATASPGATGSPTATHTATANPTPTEMKKSLLIPLLARHGLPLAETDTDEEFAHALTPGPEP